MLTTSFCRREVRVLSYVVIAFSLFAVIHVSLLKIENLQVVERLEERTEEPKQVSEREEDRREGFSTVKNEPAEFSSSAPQTEKISLEGEAGKTTARKRKKDKKDECKNMDGNLSGHFFQDEVVKFNWTEARSQGQREVFEQRSKVLLDGCAKMDSGKGVLNPPLDPIYQSNLWLKDHGLIYCPINKVGSTTWITNLLKMAGEDTRHGRGRVRKIYSAPLGLRQRKSFMKKAMRMIIVRNPLDRLLSAFRDKMLHIICKENQFMVMQKMISTKYSDPDTPTDPAGRPSFRQFLMFIREEMEKFWASKGQHEVNNHWKPFWWYCAPCHFEYNAVAHMETLSEDQEYIIRETKLYGKLNNTRTHSSKNDHFTSTREATKWYFGQIPRSLLEEIIRLYQPDFDLFGYSPEDHLALSNAQLN
ncbi:carbohydrate sulfotransferase 11-like [Penaeus japonicus]|uniref:carbohydrate sulfotransferase 11-like n=1 Tax=Penaeus japonicus TaxID=27405 RepID=UPI001C711F56|nr:carbohydrate sulfotransferase 11-like [Penaeus japonicus]